MGKHDQRILKFLNQNGSSAPTITDMMTKLNISISEISTSLNTLLAQGIIARKTNGQGIECWFPANSPMAAGADNSPSGVGVSYPKSTQNQPAPVASPYGGAAQAPTQQLMAVSAAPSSGSYQEAHSPSAGYGSSRAPVREYLPPQAPAPQPTYTPPPFNPSAMGLVPQSRGIGFGSFLLGLIAMGGLATWGGAKLSQKNMGDFSANLVDQKAFQASLTARTEFETRMQAQVLALQAELKKMNLAMDSSKGPAPQAGATPAATTAAAKSEPAASAATATTPAAAVAKPDPAVAAAEAAKKAAAAKKLAAQKAAAKKLAARKNQSARKRRAAEIEAAAAAGAASESAASPGGSGSEDPAQDPPPAE